MSSKNSRLKARNSEGQISSQRMKNCLTIFIMPRVFIQIEHITSRPELLDNQQILGENGLKKLLLEPLRVKIHSLCNIL